MGEGLPTGAEITRTAALAEPPSNRWQTAHKAGSLEPCTAAGRSEGWVLSSSGASGGQPSCRSQSSLQQDLFEKDSGREGPGELEVSFRDFLKHLSCYLLAKITSPQDGSELLNNRCGSSGPNSRVFKTLNTYVSETNFSLYIKVRQIIHFPKQYFELKKDVY